MRIASSLHPVSYLSAVGNQHIERYSRKERTDLSNPAGGDTVFLSPEAQELAGQMQERSDGAPILERQKENSIYSVNAHAKSDSLRQSLLAVFFENSSLWLDEELSEEKKSEQVPVDDEEDAFGGQGQDQVEALEQRIQKIQQEIIETESGNLPPEVKEAKIAGLQSQLSQLTQELAQAKQASAK